MQHFFTLMCPAQDSRAAVRVPFTQIVPTVVKVVDTSNEGSSGAGWTIGEGGLVRRLSRLLDPLPMFNARHHIFRMGMLLQVSDVCRLMAVICFTCT